MPDFPKKFYVFNGMVLSLAVHKLWIRFRGQIGEMC